MSDFISVSSPSADRNLLFLVDTEAHISIVEKSCLKSIFDYDKSDIISMKGITEERQMSLGSANLVLIFEHLSIEHKVHIVADNFPIPSHGIIGKDFMKRHKCLIDYDNMTLTIRPNNAPQRQFQFKPKLFVVYLHYQHVRKRLRCSESEMRHFHA